MKAIPLTQGWVAWVDDEDYERLMQHKWFAWRNGRCWYASRHSPTDTAGKRTAILMHREILNAPPELEVHHVEGESSPGCIHNWRENLRLVTPKQNNQGLKRKIEGASSRYRGVSWREDVQKWRAYIKVDGRELHLGYFDNQEDAARAYDAAARKHFGEFAAPNFPNTP